jgi:hypothetical protein
VPVIQTPDGQVSGRQFRPGPGDSHHNLDKNAQLNFVEILGPNRRPEERQFPGGRPTEGFFPGNQSLRLIHLVQVFQESVI